MILIRSRLQTATYAITAAALAVGALTAPAVAGTMRAAQYDYIHRDIANKTKEARSVGEITVGYDEGNGLVRGSGVLIGGKYVLTAAHLVDDANVGRFTINGQNYRMKNWVVADQFYSRDPDTGNPDEKIYGNGADLALVELDRHVRGARNIKAKINKNRKEAGKLATIVGFGAPGDGVNGVSVPLISDFGNMDPAGAAWSYQPVKRAGQNRVEPLGPFSSPYNSNFELRVDFDPDPSMLSSLIGLTPPQYNQYTGEWEVDKDDIPVTNEYMPSIGDSGGGLFINGRLAGITSWTTRQNSEYFSTANFTRLSVGWWRWVRANIKAFKRIAKDPSLVPWDSVADGGAGFRGAIIVAEADDDEAGITEGDPLHILGPGLFYKEDGSHIAAPGTNLGFFIYDDLAQDAGPLSYVTGLPYDGITATSLPEPASVALLGFGGLTMLRRSRR